LPQTWDGHSEGAAVHMTSEAIPRAVLADDVLLEAFLGAAAQQGNAGPLLAGGSQLGALAAQPERLRARWALCTYLATVASQAPAAVLPVLRAALSRPDHSVLIGVISVLGALARWWDPEVQELVSSVAAAGEPYVGVLADRIVKSAADEDAERTAGLLCTWTARATREAQGNTANLLLTHIVGEFAGRFPVAMALQARVLLEAESEAESREHLESMARLSAAPAAQSVEVPVGEEPEQVAGYADDNGWYWVAQLRADWAGYRPGRIALDAIEKGLDPATDEFVTVARSLLASERLGAALVGLEMIARGAQGLIEDLLRVVERPDAFDARIRYWLRPAVKAGLSVADAESRQRLLRVVREWIMLTEDKSVGARLLTLECMPAEERSPEVQQEVEGLRDEHPDVEEAPPIGLAEGGWVAPRADWPFVEAETYHEFVQGLLQRAAEFAPRLAGDTPERIDAQIDQRGFEEALTRRQDRIEWAAKAVSEHGDDLGDWAGVVSRLVRASDALDPDVAHASLLLISGVHNLDAKKAWASAAEKHFGRWDEDQRRGILHILAGWADASVTPMDDWVERAEAKDASQQTPRVGADDPLERGINTARGHIAWTLTRCCRWGPVDETVKEALHRLAGDPSSAVRACLLVNLTALFPDEYEETLTLCQEGIAHEDKRLLKYLRHYLPYVKVADAYTGFATVIEQMILSDDEETSKAGGQCVVHLWLRERKERRYVEGVLASGTVAARLGLAEGLSEGLETDIEDIRAVSLEYAERIMETEEDAGVQSTLTRFLYNATPDRSDELGKLVTLTAARGQGNSVEWPLAFLAKVGASNPVLVLEALEALIVRSDLEQIEPLRWDRKVSVLCKELQDKASLRGDQRARLGRIVGRLLEIGAPGAVEILVLGEATDTGTQE